MKCSNCGHQNRTGAKFCEDCGARLGSVCVNCGAEISPTAKFCSECGRPAGPAAPSTSFSSPHFDAPQAYTPKHLAEKILNSKAALEGERKHVTAIFADLKSSMELFADRDPEDTRKLLDPVLDHMIEAVHRFEGTVVHVLGDGIVALFGAPLAHEDHAVRACYAALRMQESVKRYAEGIRRSEGIPIHIRVGLNSGEVAVRSIGSDLRMDYTVVGQTINVAARMEQMAVPGSILISANTMGFAEGYVQVKPLGPLKVKGLEQSLDVFEVTGAAAVRSRLHAAAARGLTRFVGRDSELDQLRQALERASSGYGQVVAVIGEPGVGKSRLFWEFAHSHRMVGSLLIEATSVSYGKATTYLPVIEFLRSYFQIESRDDARKIREKITGKLLSLDRALESTLPALLALLDVPVDEEVWTQLDPPQRRVQTLNAIKRLLLRESQVQPVTVIFEDLHWIDGETQAVLDALVESVPTAKMLLLVNYRPEYQHRWSGKTYYRQLRLDALPVTSAEALLAALLGSDPSLAPLTRLLIQRAEGNPFFLEESVRTLVETKTLEGTPGAYRVTRALTALQVPATAQAILAARIDRLSQDDKRLLQAASVIGKDVPLAWLEAVAQMPESELRQSLARLQGAEFLYETQLFPEVEYTFKHALTHEVTYGTVLQERRRVLHAAIVDAIERLHADRLAEYVEVLAHHAAKGRISDKAVRYLRQAGEKAVARSANRDAVTFFETALDIIAEQPETIEMLSDALDIHLALGPALISLTGATSPRVSAVYRRALTLVERLGDTSRRFPVLWGLWFISYTMGQYADALESGKRLLKDAQAGDDSGRLVEAHHAMWPTLLAMGASAESGLHMERGIALYKREEHASQAFLYAGHDPGVCCRYQLSQVRWLLGYPDQALTLIRDAQRLAEELKHPQTTTITLWMKAWLEYQRGEREAAVRTAQQLRELATTHGFAYWLDAAIVLSHTTAKALTLPTLAALRGELGAMQSAVWRKVFLLCVFAQLCAEAGHAEEGFRALALIGEADRLAYLAPEVHRLEGQLLLRHPAPRADDAERCFRTAIDIARGRSEKSLELRATTSLSRLWNEQGRRDEARRQLAEVYAWFTEGFDTLDLRQAKALLNDLSGA